MNWSKIVLGGVVAGVVGWLVDFVQHGLILGNTYMSYPEVFSQEASSPFYFLAISVCTWIAVAILFVKTRSCWGVGWKGGATFGLWFGIAIFFLNFYPALTIDGFPYYLSWCWGGAGVITSVIAGAGLGLVSKS